MTTASTYAVPDDAAPGDTSGMSPATSCSVIGRGAEGDVAVVLGHTIGLPTNVPDEWEFTPVPPVP